MSETYNCAMDGCRAEVELPYEEEQFQVTKENRTFFQTIRRATVPIGWAYVQVRKAVKRLYCGQHFGAGQLAANYQMEIAASKVQKKIKLHNVKVLRGQR